MKERKREGGKEWKGEGRRGGEERKGMGREGEGEGGTGGGADGKAEREGAHRVFLNDVYIAFA